VSESNCRLRVFETPIGGYDFKCDALEIGLPYTTSKNY
jgi:hypothetical protein